MREAMRNSNCSKECERTRKSKAAVDVVVGGKIIDMNSVKWISDHYSVRIRFMNHSNGPRIACWNDLTVSFFWELQKLKCLPPKQKESINLIGRCFRYIFEISMAIFVECGFSELFGLQSISSLKQDFKRNFSHFQPILQSFQRTTTAQIAMWRTDHLRSEIVRFLSRVRNGNLSKRLCKLANFWSATCIFQHFTAISAGLKTRLTCQNIVMIYWNLLKLIMTVGANDNQVSRMA